MFDNAAKSLWFGDTIRRSLLDPKPTKRPDEEEGGAVPSPKTRQAMEAFFAAQEAGDADELPRRLNEVVRSWRADNAASGLSPIAHNPLPNVVAGTLWHQLMETPLATRDRAYRGLVASIEPGSERQIRMQLAQQDQGVTNVVLPQSYGAAGPSRTAGNQGKSTLAHAPTWIPEETTWEWLTKDEPSVPRGRAPDPVYDRTWEDELQARSDLGGAARATTAWRRNLRRSFGLDTSRDEVERREIENLRRTGRHPLFLAPKPPHPDDPYKDRVAWPADPPSEGNGQDVVVTSPFGPRTLPSGQEFHPGLDFRNRPASSSSKVYSPKNGTILKIERIPGGANQIFVLLDDGSILGFSHTGALQGLEEGDEVYAGQQIGFSDASGTARPGKPPAPHTHVSYYPPGTPVDPRTRKPLRGPDDHDLNAPGRIQTDPFRGLKYDRTPRNGIGAKPPMRVDRSG